MHHVNGAYTTYFNVKRARNGHLFQGRYKAILVEKDEYAKELSRYIHLNPVRAKMVQTPEQYEWTSYKFYIGNEFISSRKSNRAVPALRQLTSQVSIPDICQTVESVFGETLRLSRKVKIFLCRKHTTASLAAIGDRFDIGDSAVAQSYPRFLNETKTDRRLRRQVDKIEEMITM